MRIRKNKKVRISIILFILMFCMGIGYAALHTDIRGTGTALLKSRSFNVYYSNVQTIAGSVTPTTAPTTSGQSTTGLSWEVDLNTPGQFYEFTADVTNAGTVDAMIAEVLDTTLTTEQAQYLTYTVTYADYKPIEQYDKLAINETDSIRIRLEVKPDAQPADIPANTQIALNLGCIYGIADSNAEERTKAVTYTVTFDKNHADATGIMTAQEIIEDRATPLTANSFARTGYHFTSWNTAANGSGTSYTDGQSVTNIEDTTLYAQWAVNTYTIAFDANGGTGTMTGMSMTYGVAANLTSNDFTYSGYNFVKWNTEADGSGRDYTDEQSVNNLTTENGATVTLYAQWEQAETTVADITTENYGQYVNLRTSILDLENVTLEGGSHPEADWRVFSKDEDGVWLILADYMPNTSFDVTTVGLQVSSNATYGVNSTNRTTLINGLKGTISGKSNWNGLIAGSDLYDGSNNLINSDIKVQGAVDLDTWVASWNEKYTPRLYTATTASAMSDGLNGYYVGNTENPTTTGYQVGGTDKTLYFPHTSATSNNNGYWLASPSAGGAKYVMNVNSYGNVSGITYSNSLFGVRPAVYLPSTVKLNTSGTVWTIAE